MGWEVFEIPKLLLGMGPKDGMGETGPGCHSSGTNCVRVWICSLAAYVQGKAYSVEPSEDILAMRLLPY